MPIRLRQWWNALSPSDKLAFVGAALNSVALLVAIIAVIYAVWQTRIAAESFAISLKSIQYQNAAILLDPSNDIIGRLRQQKAYLAVLKNEITDKTAIADVEAALELYQTQIFKASILRDNDLIPPDLWTAFTKDFCDVYHGFPYIRGWWGRMKLMEPFASSATYRELSYACEKVKKPAVKK